MNTYMHSACLLFHLTSFLKQRFYLLTSTFILYVILQVPVVFVNDRQMLCADRLVLQPQQGSKPRLMPADVIIAVTNQLTNNESAQVSTYQAYVLRNRDMKNTTEICLQVWGGTRARTNLQDLIGAVPDGHAVILVLLNALLRTPSE